MTEWPAAFRTLHLPGGLRVAETVPGKAQFAPLVGGAIEFDVTQYANIGVEIRQSFGLLPLGCEFFRTEDEIEGMAPPGWRPVLPAVTNEWPTVISELAWSGLSHSAYKRGDARLYLIAGAITSQLRFGAARLLDLSNAYFQNLAVMLRKETQLSEDEVIGGYFADSVFSSIHAAFFEMATLRDYLAEAIAYMVYGELKIDSMEDLHRHLIKAPSLNVELEQEIQAVYGSKAGWLKEFSTLRNTFAHRMPFDRLAGSGVVHVSRHVTPGGLEAWQLFIPIPDPVAIDYKARFQLPADEEQFAGKVIADLKAAKARPDTLSYLFGVFAKLVELANQLQVNFPCEPEMVSLTDDMILSATINGEAFGSD